MPLPLADQLKIKAKDIFNRITLNRITTIFFLFTFVQCFSQAIMHSFLFTVDLRYYDLLRTISTASNFSAASRNFTYPPLGTSLADMTLLMCDDVNLFNMQENCQVVFDINRDVQNVTDIDQDSQLRGQIVMNVINGGGGHLFTVGKPDGLNNPLPAASTTFNESLHPVQLQSGEDTVILSQQCIQIMSYPLQHMQSAEREDLTLVFLQFWLFAITFVALIWNSVPHLLAVICARAFPACWGTYSIWRTLHQKAQFNQLIENPGTPCSVEMFTDYFAQRYAYQIADAILSVVALITALYFTLNLIKVYDNQAFKTVGAPEHIMRLYKYFHGLKACLQLEVFVLLAAMGLSADQFFNTYIGRISEHTAIYEAGFLFTAILLIPWLAMGWLAIIREMKVVMIAFLAITFIFLAGWSIMFYSQIYRWTFMMWPYIACYILASLILLVISLVLGIICWRHYGEGLAQYLRAEAALESSHFAPDRFEHDVEKNGLSYDPDAIIYELQRKGSTYSGKSRLSTGSFTAGMMKPLQPDQPKPTFFLPTLSKTKRDSISSSFMAGSPVSQPNDDFTRLAPLRRNSPF